MRTRCFELIDLMRCSLAWGLPRLFVGCLIAFAFVAEVNARDKWVLAIGNDDYENLSKLTKAANDAGYYKGLFESFGYRALGDTRHIDVDFNNFRIKLTQLFDRASGGGAEVVITYSGHGVTMEDGAGRSSMYLLPTDVTQDPVQMRANGINVQEDIIDAAKDARVEKLILIIDACRTDPTLDSSFDLGSSSVSLPGGRDYAVIFSSAHGQVAYERLSFLGEDGDDNNELSVFTRFFKRNIEKTKSLVDAFLNTQVDVIKETAAVYDTFQKPVLFSTLTREFTFEAESKPEPVQRAGAPEWASRPNECATDPALLASAVDARTNGLVSDEVIWANRKCVSIAALKSLGIERLRETEAASPVTVAAIRGRTKFNAGDTLDRVGIVSKANAQNKRPIRLKSVDEFEVFLGDHAFNPDFRWNFFIRRGESTQFLSNLKIQ